MPRKAQFTIYKPKPEPELHELDLHQRSNGDISLRVRGCADGNLLTISQDGKLYLKTSINSSLGFVLTDDGRLKVG